MKKPSKRLNSPKRKKTRPPAPIPGESSPISEKRFRGLIENVQDAILILDRKGLGLYESPSTEKVLGYRPGERKGKTVYQTTHPDDVGKVRETFKNLLAHPGRSYSLEVRTRHKKGHWVHTEVTAINRLNDPSIRGVVVSFRDVSSQKEAQSALRASEDKFRSLIENIHDVVSLIRPDGFSLYTNPSYEKVLGYKNEIRKGKNFFELIHPDDLKKVQQKLRSLARKPGMTLRDLVRVKHQDGSWRSMDVTATNRMDNPAVQGIIVNYRDVTDNLLSVEDLRQKERYFRALIDHSHDLVYILDRDGKRVYESPSVERLLGYQPGERSGTTIFDFLHPDDSEKVRGPIRKTLEKPGGMIVFTARVRHKDGRWVAMEITGKNLMMDPLIRGVVINARDITERHRAETELRESEEKFRSLIENSHDVVALVDDRGRSTYISPFYEKILGYRIQDRLGRSFFEIVHPEDQAPIRHSYLELMKKPKAIFNGFLRLKNAQGEWRHFEASATNHLDNPLVRGIILNFRDVTERKRVEDALRRSEESFRTVMDKLPVAIVIHSQLKNKYMNEAFLKLLGYQRAEELLGRSPLLDVHPEERDEVAARIAQLKSPGISNPPVERRFLRKDGSVLETETVSLSVTFQGETASMAVLYDLTEKKN